MEKKLDIIKVKEIELRETKNKKSFINGMLYSFNQYNQEVPFKIWSESEPEKFKELNEDNNIYFAIQYEETTYNGNKYLTVVNYKSLNEEEIKKHGILEKEEEIKKIKNSIIKEKQSKELVILKDVLLNNVSEKGISLLKELKEKNKDIYNRFICEYAAKGKHDAVPVGLLSHTVKMLQVLNLTLSLQENLYLNEEGKDLIFIGLLLHDIGKTKEYHDGEMTKYAKVTHRGLGIEYLVLNKDVFLKYYSEDFYYEILAIINQHHGKYEERPHSVFSYLVHLVDMYDTHITGFKEALYTNKEKDTIVVLDREIPVLNKEKNYFEFNEEK